MPIDGLYLDELCDVLVKLSFIQEPALFHQFSVVSATGYTTFLSYLLPTLFFLTCYFPIAFGYVHLCGIFASPVPLHYCLCSIL